MKKKAICIRVDSHVIEWFRAKFPKGYQTRMHSVLEEYVEDQTNKAQRLAGRAQEIFRRNYARCFWHCDPVLKITPQNISLVISGLRKYGGREGLELAEELCR